MTPEEKIRKTANEVANRFLPGVGSEFPLSHHSRVVAYGRLSDAIATAIREAREEAIQECEQIAYDWLRFYMEKAKEVAGTDDWKPMAALVLAVVSIRRDIRALRTQGD